MTNVTLLIAMLQQMLQFKMLIKRYKIVVGYNVTQLKGNTTPLTAFFIHLLANKYVMQRS